MCDTVESFKRAQRQMPVCGGLESSKSHREDCSVKEVVIKK